METAAPQHLRPFLDGTPLALHRIKAAWPILEFSQKAFLIERLLGREEYGFKWACHCDEFRKIVSKDSNPYIRYLGQVSPYIRYRAQVSEDKDQSWDSELDRLATAKFNEHADSMSFFDLEPSAFWALPQIQRLALMNGRGRGLIGAKVAKYLLYAAEEELPKKTVSFHEVFDVICQYVGGKTTLAERVTEQEEISSHVGDGWNGYSAGKGIEELWRVVPNLHPALGSLLIDALPIEKIPEETLSVLSDEQKEQLSERQKPPISTPPVASPEIIEDQKDEDALEKEDSRQEILLLSCMEEIRGLRRGIGVLYGILFAGIALVLHGWAFWIFLGVAFFLFFKEINPK